MRRETDFSDLDPDTPLRLRKAAELAFPDGSMTESGLQTEFHKGRLVCERIAGKLYTTLGDVYRMRTLCRENRREPGSTSEKQDPAERPSGSSSTDQTSAALDAAKRIAEELKRPSSNTSPKSTGRSGGEVIPLK